MGREVEGSKCAYSRISSQEKLCHTAFICRVEYSEIVEVVSSARNGVQIVDHRATDYVSSIVGGADSI
jgi:hypothetical protein